jgi:hypothetical protein
MSHRPLAPHGFSSISPRAPPLLRLASPLTLIPATPHNADLQPSASNRLSSSCCPRHQLELAALLARHFRLSTYACWSLHRDAQAKQRTDKPHPDSRVPHALPHVCVRWSRLSLRPTPRAAASALRELHARTDTLVAPSRCRVVASAREPRPTLLRHQRLDNTRSATSTPCHLWPPRLYARVHSSALLHQALASATPMPSRPIRGTMSADIKGFPLPLARTAPHQSSSSCKHHLLPCFPPLSRCRRRQLTPASTLPRLQAPEELPVEAYLTIPPTQHLIHRSSLVPLSHR